jgi:hypothetical protein
MGSSIVCLSFVCQAENAEDLSNNGRSCLEAGTNLVRSWYGNDSKTTRSGLEGDPKRTRTRLEADSNTTRRKVVCVTDLFMKKTDGKRLRS